MKNLQVFSKVFWSDFWKWLIDWIVATVLLILFFFSHENNPAVGLIILLWLSGSLFIVLGMPLLKAITSLPVLLNHLEAQNDK
jgi:membrane-bound ClpP family serine protease